MRAQTCNGVLFIESVCEDWLLKIWEAKTDYSVAPSVFQDPGNILSQSIIDTGEPAHGKVLDFTYNSNTLWSGLNHFRIPDAAKSNGVGFTDMSDFLWGKISFDVRVITNPNAAKIVTRVECIWPCNSRDNVLNIPALNQWVHIELSVADLVSQGLNLQHVDVAFEINPEWGKQAGVQLQIDNVKWEKGTAPNTTCATEGAVFIDSMCAPWNPVSYLEMATNRSFIYTEAATEIPGQLITQKIIDSPDVGRTKVLDISYNGNTNLSGNVRAFSSSLFPNGVDMSAFKDGIYVFDIKVLTIGDVNADLLSTMECGWPCNTEQQIKIKALNQWQTVAISARELMNAGLDLQRVRTGFNLMPDWGRQANWHFQIDNVRWIKTNESTNRIKCFAQHFNNNPVISTFILDSSVTHKSLLSWQSYLGIDVILNPQWNDLVSGEGFRYLVKDEAATLTACLNSGRTKRGVLSGQIYVSDAYTNDGKLRPALVLLNGSYNFQYTVPFNNFQLMPREWTTFTYDLSTVQADFSDIRFIGFQFNPNGKDPSITGDIKIDNLIVTTDP